LNLQLIRSTIQKTGLLDRLFNKPEAEETYYAPQPELPPQTLPAAGPAEAPSTPIAQPQPAEPVPAAGAAETGADGSEAGLSAPEIKPAAPPATPATAPPPATSRDRPLYFIEVGEDGAVVRTRVIRPMPATDSPLADAIQLLLQGPTVDERNRGLISLIPPGTRFLSAQVRGSTAYLSFSEEFQFNTYGVEGYIGQLRQIIWTATEFPNVSDVQILIEGRRIDYLGERIAIGSPLGRNSF
jgi:hypothetical protein